MSGVTFRPGSTGGIGNTIAVGLVSYFDETGAGHVLNDGFWTPAKEDPAGWSIVSIGGIDIFIGFIAKALDDLSFTSNCREYALEAIIKWFISIFMIMIIVYSSCYNCINWKHNTCVGYKHQESLVSL